MDVVLLHDPREPPFDLFAALVDAGHRVASHGGDAVALSEFLDAMTWRPQAFVLDCRGRAARAAPLARALAALAPGARIVVAHADAATFAAVGDVAPGARAAGSAGGVAAALGGP